MGISPTDYALFGFSGAGAGVVAPLGAIAGAHEPHAQPQSAVAAQHDLARRIRWHFFARQHESSEHDAQAGVQAAGAHVFTGAHAAGAHTFTGAQAAGAHTFTGAQGAGAHTFTGAHAAGAHTFTGAHAAGAQVAGAQVAGAHRARLAWQCRTRGAAQAVSQVAQAAAGAQAAGAHGAHGPPTTRSKTADNIGHLR